MRRRAGHWSLAMQSAIAVSVVAAILIGVFASSAGGASTDDARVAAGELRARAAEAQLLAERASAHQLPAAFVRAQSRQLARQIADVERELAKIAATLPSQPAREAAALAPDVLSLVQALERAVDDTPTLSSVERSLAERKDKLDALERALGRRPL